MKYSFMLSLALLTVATSSNVTYAMNRTPKSSTSYLLQDPNPTAERLTILLTQAKVKGKHPIKQVQNKLIKGFEIRKPFSVWFAEKKHKEATEDALAANARIATQTSASQR